MQIVPDVENLFGERQETILNKIDKPAVTKHKAVRNGPLLAVQSGDYGENIIVFEDLRINLIWSMRRVE